MLHIKNARHTVGVISDLQAPFQHRDFYDFLWALRKKHRPDTWVCIGDESDQHTVHPQYNPDPDGLSGGDELMACRKALKPLYTAFPDMLVCTSNHTDRIFRKAFNAGIPSGYIKSFRDFLEAPSGWQWADSWEIDGVVYEHGDAVGGLGARAALSLPALNQKPTVFGHHHNYPGVQWFRLNNMWLWGMNVGCLIDEKQYAFRYGNKNKRKPVLGTGFVIKGLPIWHPMLLDKNRRWNGRLII